MLFMSQIPLLRTMTETYTSSPIWQFSEKLFEAIRSHFLSTLIVLEPSYSYFLPFISRHISFAVILKSASSHGVGVFSVKLKGFRASSLRTLVFIYSVFPLSNSIPAVSVVSTISLASASPLFLTFIVTSILLSPVDLESYVSLLVSIFISKLEIKIETNKDTYDSKSTGDSKIDVSINVKNNGDAEAKDIVLTTDTAGVELLKGKTEYINTRVLKDEALKPFNLTLKTPTPWEDADFNITAKLICLDIKGKKYEYEGSKTIKVDKKWDLIASKSFSENCHMGELVYVSVIVRNKGICDINNILLNDSIVSGMRLQEDTTLNKTLSLKAGETAEKVLKYTLIPETPGEFTFPTATANFTLPNGQSKEVSSNNSGTVKINGPNITVIKTVDKQQLNTGDILNLTVMARNTGTVSYTHL